MRRLPNGHIRLESHEKAIFEKVRARVLALSGDWFTPDELVDEIKRPAPSLEDVEEAVRHLRRDPGGGYIVEIGEAPEAVNGRKYRITGKRNVPNN